MNSRKIVYRTSAGTEIQSSTSVSGEFAFGDIPNTNDIQATNPKDLSFGVKEPLSLVPPEFIRQVSRCMEDGVKKRSAYNWRQSGVSAMQLADKVLRHTLDFIDGKDITDDSKLSNLASAAADLAVMIDAQKYGVLIDDRPVGKRNAS